jgi:hypothetical protein
MKSVNEWPGNEREDALVASLVALHRERRGKATPAAAGSEHQRVVAHFERRSERLRGEKLVTGEIVDQLLGASAALAERPVHRELELRGAAGASAAGRFRIRNRAIVPSAFELAVGEAISGPTPRAVRLEPGRQLLAPGETAWVRVEVSLAGFAPGERATLPVHCRWDGGWERLWLVAEAEPELGGAR